MDRKVGIGLRIGVVVVAIGIGIFWVYLDHKHRKEADFHGVVVEKYYRRSTRFGLQDAHLPLDGSENGFHRRSPRFYVDVQTKTGIVDYQVYQHDLEAIELGDYVVKLPGQEQFALFHDGKQVTGAGDFRNDPVPLPAEATQPAVQPTPPPPVAAAPKPSADATIKSLMDQASQLWKAGEREGSIQASEKALMLTDQAYGKNSAQYQELYRRIQQAKQATGR